VIDTDLVHCTKKITKNQDKIMIIGSHVVGLRIRREHIYVFSAFWIPYAKTKVLEI
jgi:hypothetical protein